MRETQSEKTLWTRPGLKCYNDPCRLDACAWSWRHWDDGSIWAIPKVCRQSCGVPSVRQDLQKPVRIQKASNEKTMQISLHKYNGSATMQWIEIKPDFCSSTSCLEKYSILRALFLKQNCEFLTAKSCLDSGMLDAIQHSGISGQPSIIPSLSIHSTNKEIDFYIKEEIVNGHRMFICAACGMNTSRKSSVARHLTTVHAPKADLKCDICGVVYKNSLAFQEHLRRKGCNVSVTEPSSSFQYRQPVSDPLLEPDHQQ